MREGAAVYGLVTDTTYSSSRSNAYKLSGSSVPVLTCCGTSVRPPHSSRQQTFGVYATLCVCTAVQLTLIAANLARPTGLLKRSRCSKMYAVPSWPTWHTPRFKQCTPCPAGQQPGNHKLRRQRPISGTKYVDWYVTVPLVNNTISLMTSSAPNINHVSPGSAFTTTSA